MGLSSRELALARMKAKRELNLLENGKFNHRFRTPEWIGEPDFEDLTTKWLAASDEQAALRSPSPISDGSKASSLNSLDLLGESESSKTSSGINALDEMRLSRQEKKDASEGRYYSNDDKERHSERIFFKYLKEKHRDEEYDRQALSDAARAFTLYQIEFQDVRLRIETAKTHFLKALDAFEDTKFTERDGEVCKALKEIVKLDKGKARLDEHNWYPWVNMRTEKEVADWIIWEAKDYCHMVKREHIDVDEEVLKRTKAFIYMCAPDDDMVND